MKRTRFAALDAFDCSSLVLFVLGDRGLSAVCTLFGVLFDGVLSELIGAIPKRAINSSLSLMVCSLIRSYSLKISTFLPLLRPPFDAFFGSSFVGVFA